MIELKFEEGMELALGSFLQLIVMKDPNVELVQIKKKTLQQVGESCDVEGNKEEKFDEVDEVVTQFSSHAKKCGNVKQSINHISIKSDSLSKEDIEKIIQCSDKVDQSFPPYIYGIINILAAIQGCTFDEMYKRIIDETIDHLNSKS